MRKFLLLLTFIIYFINSNSQNSKFEIGPEIGLNFSHYHFAEAKYMEGYAIKRISFGAVAKFNFSKNWALKSKLKYEGKGSQKNDSRDQLYLTQKLNYLIMPLMAEWRFGNGNLQGFLNLGVYGGILLSASKEFRNNGQVDNKDKFNPLDSGIAYGTGAIYKLKKNLKITLDLGGQYGMVLIDSQDTNNNGWRSINMYSGNIGLLFGL